MRRKILPAFEPLSESTESESDESKKNSPVEEKKRAEQGMRKSEHPEKEGEVKSAPTSAKQEEQEERREELRTPGPVDIVGAGEEFEEGEISSSSEIEVMIMLVMDIMTMMEMSLMMSSLLRTLLPGW